MQQIHYFEYHSFPDADAPFTGNPAGVCFLDAFPADGVMRGIAASNKHAETAFLTPAGPATWNLRWFTPAIEVDLCGHATLAAGAAVFDSGLAAQAAHFDTRSGRLSVSKAAGQLRMDFPLIPSTPVKADARVVTALGGPQAVDFHEIGGVHGARYCLVVLPKEADVAGLQPDIAALRAMETNVVVTAKGVSADFVSRFFAPASGIDEDPVTGSAHCTLAPYWAERLSRKRLSARQIGPRPGALDVEVRGDRVNLMGRATKYLEGTIVF